MLQGKSLLHDQSWKYWNNFLTVDINQQPAKFINIALITVPIKRKRKIVENQPNFEAQFLKF